MLELLSPAGSMEALRAAVQNGANAVYLGGGSFNARRGAKNFTSDELVDAVRYCHIRGVQVHLTLNTLISDREMPKAADFIRFAARAGVDAFIVQDLGIAALCRQMTPEIPLHASTQMSIHSLAGVRQAEELGFSRVVLARELSREEIAFICRNSSVQIEVFVHGALCMCYSGQCYMSSVIGRRSGNRGECAQPCRLPYGYSHCEDRYPLSLKDNCLIAWLRELESYGVASLKIEGRMKRPEYVAVATRIYREAITSGKVQPDELTQLRDVFSRQGFTQGYYTNSKSEMFGVRVKESDNRPLYAAARATYENTEAPLVPVRFYAIVNARQNAMLAVQDEQGHICKTEGPVPETAVNKPLTSQELHARLAKTGGTPYDCLETKCVIEPGVTLSAAALNAMRRDVLTHLTAVRGRRQTPLELDSYTAPMVYRGSTKKPVLTVSVTRADQITPKLLEQHPAMLYVPLNILREDCSWLSAVSPETCIAAALPRVVRDMQTQQLLDDLDFAYNAGVRCVLAGNLGQISLARSRGFAVCGDFGLNLFNSRAMNQMQALGLKSATVSFEATLPQIRDLSKAVATELLIYGRLPLMLTENCVIREKTGACSCGNGVTKLVDRKGEEFRVIRDQDSCRSIILNSKKLYLLDKRAELAELGLWALRLQFTTENPIEVNGILSDWNNGGSFDPGACTRGLYLRGVE